MSEGIVLYGTDETVFPWADDEDFETILERNGFSNHPRVRIGEASASSYLTIEIYTRNEKPRCILTIGDFNGSIDFAVNTAEEALTIAASWAPMVTASATGNWPHVAADFMLSDMPSSEDIRRQREADRRGREEIVARRRQRAAE